MFNEGLSFPVPGVFECTHLLEYVFDIEMQAEVMRAMSRSFSSKQPSHPLLPIFNFQ